jgi:hypothetical protein
MAGSEFGPKLIATMGALIATAFAQLWAKDEIEPNRADVRVPLRRPREGAEAMTAD